MVTSNYCLNSSLAMAQRIRPPPVSLSMDVCWAHPRWKSESFIKLFFARYLSVNPERLEVAIGCPPLSLTRDTWYDTRVKDLIKHCAHLQKRTFGKDSYLARITIYSIQKYNLKAAIFNIATQAILLDIPDTNEDEEVTQERIESRNEWRAAQEDHIAQYRAQLKRNVEHGEARMRALEDPFRTPHATRRDIEAAAKALGERQETYRNWQPQLPTTFTKKADAPAYLPLYDQMPVAMQEVFWLAAWKVEYSYNMLYETRSVVNIRDTADKAEEYYRQAFVFWAMELYKDYESPMTSLGKEAHKCEEEDEEKDLAPKKTYAEAVKMGSEVHGEDENVAEQGDQTKSEPQKNDGKAAGRDGEHSPVPGAAAGKDEPRKKRVSRHRRAIKALANFNEAIFPDEVGLEMLKLHGTRPRHQGGRRR